jgi:hypothetical protein
MFDPEVTVPLRRFASLMERLHMRCVVGGSVASSLLGIPRQTIDLDVVVEMEPEDIAAFVREAGADFYVSESAVRSAVLHRTGFNLVHAETAFKVDVYVSGDSEFDRLQFARATEVAVPGAGLGDFHVASPEDVILRKLEWYRLGGKVSERQWHDVLGVLKVQAERLDLDYMTTWARSRDVEDLLRTALGEAGLGPPD